MRSGDGELTRRRAASAARELLDTARYRHSLVFERPGVYLAMIERLGDDMQAIGDWRVILRWSGGIDSVLWRDVEQLAYVAQSVRRYISAPNREQFAREVAKHRAIFRDVESRLNHAVEKE